MMMNWLFKINYYCFQKILVVKQKIILTYYSTDSKIIILSKKTQIFCNPKKLI